MVGILNIPKFIDFRNKIKRHKTKKFPVLNLQDKSTIAIHHSLTKQGLGGSNAFSYSEFHVDTLGWPSIGYSYVIEPDGTIKFCNDIELRTYHVGDHNNYCVGVVLTGDFRSENPTKEQEQSLRNLVAALQKQYPHLKNIKGHSEFKGYEWKACPVFDFRKVLAGGTITTASSKPIVKAPVLTYKSTGRTVTLPAIAKTWPTYNLDVKPTANNSTWSLTPSAFGGLAYDILADPYANIVTIKTSQGYRNIPVGEGTGAIIKEVAKVERKLNEESQAHWDRATTSGYLDGTRPFDPVKRYEVAIIVNRVVDAIRKHITDPLVEENKQLKAKLDKLEK